MSSTPSKRSPDEVLNELDLRAKMDGLIDAGTNANTEDTYKYAIRHFQLKFGCVLPCNEDDVVRFLATFAEELAVKTLQVRLAALSDWHLKQGFTDPTKANRVLVTMRGIRKKYSKPSNQAKAVSLTYLDRIITSLDQEAAAATHALQAGSSHPDSPLTRDARMRLLRVARDKAILLVGFWGAFRSDELTRIEADRVTGSKGFGIQIFLSHSKGDRDAHGRTCELQALAKYCPATAYYDWLEESGITSGPVFRSISQWGVISDRKMSPKSLGPVLRAMYTSAGLNPEQISTHSLRRGFAHWASEQNWDLISLMKYVGWKSSRSAEVYVKPRYDFGSLGLQRNSLYLSEEASSKLQGNTYTGIAHRVDHGDR